MPHTGHRLDLLLLPPDPESVPHRAIERLLARLRGLGVLDARGRAGPAAPRWVDGGFRSLVVDDPGRVSLYANGTGGFRVRCPRCGANLVPIFHRALEAHRAGAPRRCTCPACGADLPLEVLDFAPPAGFARVAVVTVDVEHAGLTDEAWSWVREDLGAWRAILRRP